MNRSFYAADIPTFLSTSSELILGILAKNNEFSLELTQRETWNEEIEILKKILNGIDGSIYFEYSIPRMGRRIDTVLIIQNVIFLLEFKIGASTFLQADLDQVADYALDLKNFHKTSHLPLIAPILIITKTKTFFHHISTSHHNDNILFSIKTNPDSLRELMNKVLEFAEGETIDVENWSRGSYEPTPTIIQAATALYRGHSVSEISSSSSSAKKLAITSAAVAKIIEEAKEKNEKVICFVTGVPGAGKTLVGLNIAARHFKKTDRSSTVFLSGNGPLVDILREALTRDKVKREKQNGIKVTKKEIQSVVKTVIQNIHHFRDDCLKDLSAPFEHVTIFDEAQRAWNLKQTSSFMQVKKKIANFNQSEPHFLISCLDRHKDWAVIVCLVGGGQEINTGEAGIGEWIETICNYFPDWRVHLSNKLTDSEYTAGNSLELLHDRKHVNYSDDFHLSVSQRSFRAEKISLLIKNLLDINLADAISNYNSVKNKYRIVITRDVVKAKKWVKEQARGTERYGIVASSQAQRLKPLAVDVKSPMKPIHWFLDDRDDVRSSYYLEDVATEFHVQGLELDWSCVTWDGDFRFSKDGWTHFSFVGTKWNTIQKEVRKKYLKNAYRVLLTRARQGMVIVVPEGDIEDPTRNPAYYNPTFEYLREIGFEII